jgi:hypothetical protein
MRKDSGYYGARPNHEGRKELEKSADVFAASSINGIVGDSGLGSANGLLSADGRSRPFLHSNTV